MEGIRHYTDRDSRFQRPVGKTMIFRTIHNRDNPYFQMNRASVNDERLSYKAIGIHTYLMSKPDQWEANEADITNRHSDGKASVRAGVQELIEFGYMVRVQLRQDNKIVGWRLDTYETPQLNPHYEPGKAPGYVVIELDSENQNVDELDSDFLDVEKQDVGNRNHSNYREEVNKEVKGKMAADKPATQPAQAAQLPPSTSFSQSKSTTGDPYMDAAADRAKQRQADNGVKVARRGGGWPELDKKVPAAVRLPLVERLIDMHGLRKLIDDVGDDTKLNDMHQLAADLYVMGFTTVADIETVYEEFKKDWRGKTPGGRQLANVASAMKQPEPPPAPPAKKVLAFKEFCLREFTTDIVKHIPGGEAVARERYARYQQQQTH